MTNFESKRQIFWENFQEVLIENGEPFEIVFSEQNIFVKEKDLAIEFERNGIVLKNYGNGEERCFAFDADKTEISDYESIAENIIKEIAEYGNSKKEEAKMATELKQGVGTFGGKAREAYDRFCIEFNWDPSKGSAFAQQQRLYSTDATEEGYSVWFLAHSNLNDDSEGGIWKNTIYRKKSIYYNTIEERWDEKWENSKTGEGLHTDQTTRVTFVKLSNGKYTFLGVFKFDKIEEKYDGTGKRYWLKTYSLVSEQYPV